MLSRACTNLWNMEEMIVDTKNLMFETSRSDVVCLQRIKLPAKRGREKFLQLPDARLLLLVTVVTFEH